MTDYDIMRVIIYYDDSVYLMKRAIDFSLEKRVYEELS